LGGAPSRASDLTVETALRWTEQKWEVTVDITLAGHSGTRRILVDTCQDAADFVAVAVVLAVDPARAERWSSDEPVEAPEPQPTRAADLDLDERDGAHAGDESTTMIAEPWQAGADPPSRFDSGAGSGSAWALRPHLSGALELATGVLPEPRLGPSVALGVRLERWSLGLAGRWFPPASTSPDHAEAPIDFSLIDARLLASYLVLGSQAKLGPIASLTGGSIRAKQRIESAQVIREPWVAFGAGAMGAFAFHPDMSVFGEIEVAMPLTQPSFVLDDGSHVHRVGYGLRAALGLRVFFMRQ